MSSKGKLRKFAEIKEFPNVIQPTFNEVFKKDYPLKGKWRKEFFKNDNPITLELACGKGEYTVGQAELFPNRNFIGIDIKGARIWRGAKTAIEKNLTNVGFLRTRIELINSFFSEGEIEEIWITFPDPQPRKPKHRLTSARFLTEYRKIMSAEGTVNLKTDNPPFYQFTMNMVKHNNLQLLNNTEDIYNTEYSSDPRLTIKTFYEKSWLEQGLKSHYLQFNLQGNNTLENPPEPD